MPPVSFHSRRRVVSIAAALLTALCLIGLIGPVFSGGLDRNQQCVSNVEAIANSLNLYAQDYDERLPQPIAFSSIASFQNLVGIYLRGGPGVLRCPANGNAYYTLNAALGGTQLAQFSDFYTVEVARDSKPHPDGKLTVGFLDGHAERGGIDQTPTDVACRQNAQKLTQAFSAYTQDYDEHFPFQPNDADFRQELAPYTRTSHVFICPDTGQFYNINRDIRGMALYEIPDPSLIVLFQDPIPHQNGLVTTGYLDGYVEQRGPKGITYPNPNPPDPSPDTSLSNFKRLESALLQYEQDYDERLPVYKNYPELLQKLYPDYTGKGSRILQSLSQPTYQADPTFSGVSIDSIQFPATTVYLRDVADFGDGLLTYGYLDGHAARVPRGPQRQASPTGLGKGLTNAQKN